MGHRIPIASFTRPRHPLIMRGMKHLPIMVRRFMILAGLLMPSAALAEEVARLKQGNQGWISVVIAIVLIVGVGVGSFINPKRSHRD